MKPETRIRRFKLRRGRRKTRPVKPLYVVWTGTRPDGSPVTLVGTCDCPASEANQQYPGGTRGLAVAHLEGCAALDPARLVEAVDDA